jgi:hypothetical protein
MAEEAKSVNYDIYTELSRVQLELYLAQLELTKHDVAMRNFQIEYPGQESNIWLGAVCNALHHQPVQQAVESADYITKEFRKRFGLLKVK